MTLAWRSEETIALRYPLYRPRDPLCCPSAGSKVVRFRWNGTRSVALDGIPTDDGRAPKHR